MISGAAPPRSAPARSPPPRGEAGRRTDRAERSRDARRPNQTGPKNPEDLVGPGPVVVGPGPVADRSDP
jgi:hypothetical protein